MKKFSLPLRSAGIRPGKCYRPGSFPLRSPDGSPPHSRIGPHSSIGGHSWAPPGLLGGRSVGSSSCTCPSCSSSGSALPVPSGLLFLRFSWKTILIGAGAFGVGSAAGRSSKLPSYSYVCLKFFVKFESSCGRQKITSNRTVACRMGTLARQYPRRAGVPILQQTHCLLV